MSDTQVKNVKRLQHSSKGVNITTEFFEPDEFKPMQLNITLKVSSISEYNEFREELMNRSLTGNNSRIINRMIYYLNDHFNLKHLNK